MKDEDVLGRWYTRFDTFAYSTQEFYESLYQALARREIPSVTFSRKTFPEGAALLSAKRDYFQVKRGELVFILCAAPFGIDFFVSWWLLEPAGCLSIIPGFTKLTRRIAFYKEDTAAVFRDVVHEAVLETIDAIFKSKDRTFEGDRKPVSRSRLL